MIRKSLEVGAKVWHERFGFGKLYGYDGMYAGYAIVEFSEFPGKSLIHRKRLIEVV